MWWCCWFFWLGVCFSLLVFFFFFNDTATTEIYTLSLHDALPICDLGAGLRVLRASATRGQLCGDDLMHHRDVRLEDRKSTRLNSSHSQISYAVFCLKKKKKRKSNDCLDAHLTRSV